MLIMIVALQGTTGQSGFGRYEVLARLEAGGVNKVQPFPSVQPERTGLKTPAQNGLERSQVGNNLLFLI
ncbi:hypothetical protein MiSe_65200 [Microseira wollei NIES-4236]|uniref:Uncharacterized protein n=1 Tax=Microseira wollei NIES-4236 TaxID=2530354 RepID=A0AAV3XJD8_9CYAN|nr:hypothetical protein MiSe_65200 [Microseira wollei NIES-4236]